MIAAVVAATVAFALAIRPALNHDQDLPISVTGRRNK